MKHHMQLYGFVALATMALVFAKNTYLEEKPPYIKSCRLADPSFNSCYAKNFEGIFKNWKDGVPGLKSAGTLDPLYVKRITITQNNNSSLVQMNVNMINSKLTGLSDVKIKDVNIDFKTGDGTIKFRSPKLEVKSDYSVKGRLFNVPVDASGKAYFKIDDFFIEISFHFKLRDEFGYTFTDVDALKLQNSEVGGFYIELENLFNGQKELEESTNLIINENWRDFYAILGPAIKDAMESVLYDRLKKVFGYLPGNYIVEDIPTAKQIYG